MAKQIPVLRLTHCDINGHEELFEVEVVIAVGVEDPHDMTAKALGVS